MLIYNLGLLQLKLNISAGLNYTNMTNKNFKNRLTGGSLNFAQSLLNDKLSLNLNNTLMVNHINNEKGTILNMALNGNYRFLPKHALSLNINIINNSFGRSSTVPSFNEIRGDIGYVFSF